MTQPGFPILASFVLTLLIGPSASAWPSADVGKNGNIHKNMTHWAIDQLAATHPELATYRAQLVEGSLMELHEVPVSGSRYGLDLEAERVRHKGTNEGSNATRLWWTDARDAYRAGNKERAFFTLGILLHFIQDMGVPAHANYVEHQGPGSWTTVAGFGGTFLDSSGVLHFDALEALSMWNWEHADFTALNKADPGHKSPSLYYGFSQDWARADKVWSKQDSLTFPIRWDSCDENQKDLLAYRLGRTSVVTKWTLNAAANGF